MEVVLFDFLIGLIQSFLSVATWLTTPLFNGFSPLTLISGSGIIAIIGIWVVKFLNPLS